jgi:SAM-dependent methyltransferase
VKLNVGCGGGKYAFYDLKCEVNCDVQKPKTKISNFVISDVCHLPFRDKVFQTVYAFNVLEHVSDQNDAVRELNRIGNRVTIRFDKIYNLANWLTADHESIAVANTLTPFPKPIRFVVRLVRFPIDHSDAFQRMIHESFPILRKMGLLDKWNYYEIR